MKIRLEENVFIDPKHVEMIRKISNNEIYLRFSSGCEEIVGCKGEAGSISTKDDADTFIHELLDYDNIGGEADIAAKAEYEKNKRILEIGEKIMKKGGLSFPNIKD